MAQGWSDTLGAQNPFTDLLAMTASMLQLPKTTHLLRSRCTLTHFYLNSWLPLKHSLGGTLCAKCVLNADRHLFMMFECVAAEVNSVEGKPKICRTLLNGTTNQQDAGRRSAIMLVQQQVKPHVVAERLIAMTNKVGLS